MKQIWISCKLDYVQDNINVKIIVQGQNRKIKSKIQKIKRTENYILNKFN